MRRVLPPLSLALVLALPSIALGQNQGGVVFAAYYECDPAMEALLDQVVMESIGPIYQQHVDSGDLTNWGWNAHAIGGAWRRLAFMIAPDRATALRVRASILQEVQTEQAAAGQMVNTICPTHEDYIWGIAQASQLTDPGAGPAAATMTTYYSCNQGLEAQADAVVENAIAPVLEDLVREGQLTGWSWLVHQAGGWYRRAAVFNGDSHAGILDARDALVARLADDESVARLNEVCSSHADYNWNPVTAN